MYILDCIRLRFVRNTMVKGMLWHIIFNVGFQQLAVKKLAYTRHRTWSDICDTYKKKAFTKRLNP